MADKSVAMQATDLFSLHANFKEQSSSDNDAADFAQVPDANGDVAGGCESAAFNNRNEYSMTANYCGTDIVSDFGTFLTTFGEVQNSKAIEEIVVEFSNDAYPAVTVRGHNHDSNAHSSLQDADVSSVIPASTGGVGCPDIWTDAGTDSSPIGVTVTFGLEHVDVNGEDGEHWVGDNKNFRADVTARYVGSPTLTTTGWKVDSQESSDSNDEFDTFTITAHKYFART